MSELLQIVSSAVLSIGFLGATLIFFKDFLADLLSNRVKHRLHAELEEMKSDLRQRESEISELRSGALNAYWGRRSAADERTIKALETTWNHMMRLRYSMLPMVTAEQFDLSKVSKIAAQDHRVGPAFDKMFQGTDEGVMTNPNVRYERPFLPEKAWALFEAYHTIVSTGFAKMKMVGIGFDPNQLLDAGFNDRLVSTILEGRIDEVRVAGKLDLRRVLFQLEEEFHLEAQRWLSGEVETEAELQHARRIQKAIIAGAAATGSKMHKN